MLDVKPGLERMPSQSNPADGPSREECAEWLGSGERLRVDVVNVWAMQPKVQG